MEDTNNVKTNVWNYTTYETNIVRAIIWVDTLVVRKERNRIMKKQWIAGSKEKNEEKDTRTGTEKHKVHKDRDESMKQRRI